LELKTCRKV